MSSIKYIRKIIEVESRLGFMFVPAKGQNLLPNQNSKVKVHCIGKKETTFSLTYNAEYNRIFGLTKWYRDNNIQEGTFIDVAIKNGEVILKTQTSKKSETKTTSLQKPTINTSNIPSGAKGNIVEDRIKELILLLGEGVLNVYKPVIDNEGIDLVALKNGQFHPIFLQIKSRYTAYKEQKFILTLSKNFKAHHSYYLVGVSFNPITMEVEEPILMVPSKELLDKAIQMSDGKYRVTASLKPSSNDQWQPYMVSKEKFIAILFEKFTNLEIHYT